MIAEKYFQNWNGKDYIVRLVPIDETLGIGSPVAVADVALWKAIEKDYYDVKSERHAEACKIDDAIYFYCESEFIGSDPSDEEMAKVLIEVY